MAGCKDVPSFGIIVTELCRVLQTCEPGIEVDTCDIHMLNAHLKLDMEMALLKVNECLIRTHGVLNSFDPTTYHAVVARYPAKDRAGNVTFSIFKTGSILMTVKSYKELDEAHNFICRILKSCSSEIKLGREYKRPRI